MLHQLLYLSRSVRPMTQADLDSIRDSAGRRNPEHQLTGMLLYVGGNFMQLLEGEKQDIDAVYARIQTDPRHKNCKELFLIPATCRLFPNWSMNVVNVESWSAQRRREFVEIILDAETPGRLQPEKVLAYLGGLQANRNCASADCQ